MIGRHSRLNLDLFNRKLRPVNSKENSLLLRAQSLSKTSKCPFKVGAIIVKRNRIIASAVNQTKTHPQQKYWSDRSVKWPSTMHNFLHAELACIIQASSEDMNKAAIYVARTNKNGEPRISFPCKICFPALQHAGIKKIVCYSVDNDPVAIDL